ncbi:MarR family winged helix-turn-helix transcriptional regulator [Planococcus sp. APC 4015]|nr:MarR family winged helix-turn-helix transcriptional regulator [Planococcus sp. APC 4015]
MTENPAEQIAAALAQLRGPRPSGPPFGGDGRFGPPWRQHPGHSEHHHPHRVGRGEHGPMGRFAARFRLLEALAAASAPLSVSEIADVIGVDQPRASRLVQAAVAEGHVRRDANEADARRTDIVLTDQGKAVIAQFRGARTDAVATALAGFTADERAQLAALLSKLAASWPR